LERREDDRSGGKLAIVEIKLKMETSGEGQKVSGYRAIVACGQMSGKDV
jgi:hypothetical protein